MFGLLELNDRVECFEVAACKCHEMHRERMASPQRAVYAQGLRRHRVKCGEEGVGSVNELFFRREREGVVGSFRGKRGSHESRGGR